MCKLGIHILFRTCEFLSKILRKNSIVILNCHYNKNNILYSYLRSGTSNIFSIFYIPTCLQVLNLKALNFVVQVSHQHSLTSLCFLFVKHNFINDILS